MNELGDCIVHLVKDVRVSPGGGFCVRTSIRTSREVVIDLYYILLARGTASLALTVDLS